MENRNQRVATGPRKANLVSPLCSGRGSGDTGATVATFKKMQCFETGSGLFKECSVEPKF